MHEAGGLRRAAAAPGPADQGHGSSHRRAAGAVLRLCLSTRLELCIAPVLAHGAGSQLLGLPGHPAGRQAEAAPRDWQRNRLGTQRGRDLGCTGALRARARPAHRHALECLRRRPGGEQTASPQGAPRRACLYRCAASTKIASSQANDAQDRPTTVERKWLSGVPSATALL